MLVNSGRIWYDKSMFGKYKIFVIVVVLGAISLIPGFSKFQDLASKNRGLKSQIKELRVANKTLMERQHRIQTDPLYIESVARQKLNVAKEGEIVYKILPGQD